MYNAPYQGVADGLAKYGRYGDSMLVHMNPIEVGILASLSPTGELTTNPVTGQKEAFLPFLAPLLGSFLGSSLLTGAGAGALGGLIGAKGLSSAAAGAIGSALAQTAATGDLKEGIISGLTGFGLGKAFGAASDALKAAAPATSNVPSLAEAASKAVPNVPMDVLSQLSPADLKALAPAAAESGAQSVAANAAKAATSPTGAFFGELTKPGTFLPIYAGTSASESIRQQEELDKIMREQGLSEEEARKKYAGDAERAIATAAKLYPSLRPKGMAAGGRLESYADGGMFSNQYGLSNTSGGFYDTPYGQISPSDVQSRLRGTVSVAAPYASYGALDVGGSGYLPGIAPEFQYFRQPEEVYPQPIMQPYGRGKGGGFGGGMGGGYGSMPGGKGGGYGGGYSGPGFGQYDPYGYGGGYGGYDDYGGGYGGYNDYGYGGGYGSSYGGGYSSMPSKGGYANPSNSMGYGGYNTSFSPSYGGGYGGGFGNYGDSFQRFMP